MFIQSWSYVGGICPHLRLVVPLGYRSSETQVKGSAREQLAMRAKLFSLAAVLLICFSALGDVSEHKTTKAAPAPRNAALDEAVNEEIRQVEVGGEAVSMSELGPIIINADGTMRRIRNWDQLTQREKDATISKISKRNKIRLEKLRESQSLDDQEGEQDGGEEEEETQLLLTENSENDENDKDGEAAAGVPKVKTFA